MTDYEAKRQALVEQLHVSGHVRTPAVLEAMRRVPRERFVPRFLSHRAYRDEPIPIGHGQTISAPHMVGIMTEALDLRPGLRVLEVGTGSGYQAAILSRLIAPGGRLLTIERIRPLAERARKALKETGAEGIEVREGDGSLGAPDEALFDRIVVTCAAPRPPPPLLEQRAPNGVLLIPIGDQHCELVRIRKTERGDVSESLGPCAFVPLRGRHGHPSGAFGS